MGQSLTSAGVDAESFFERGLACSTGVQGAAIDLIEAHKWFNLAAMNGSGVAQAWRAEIAEQMSPREIALAQRQARAWLTSGARMAA